MEEISAGKISPKKIPNSNNYMKKSTHVCRNDVWELFQINRDKPLIDHLSGTTKTLFGHLCLDTLLANLFLGALLGNPCLATLLANLLLGTCSCEPCLGTLLGNLLLRTLLGNLFVGTFGNLFLETLLGNLFLGTFGNLAWELGLGTGLGNLAWEPLPGNLGTLAIRILAAPTCSGTFTIDIATQTWLAGKSIICIDDYRCVFSVISYKPPFTGDFPAATFGQRLTSCSHQPRIIHHLYATLWYFMPICLMVKHVKPIKPIKYLRCFPCFPYFPWPEGLIYESFAQQLHNSRTAVDQIALQGARNSRRCAEMRRRTGSSLLMEPPYIYIWLLKTKML